MPRRKATKPSRFDAVRLFDTEKATRIEDRVAELVAQQGKSKHAAEKQAAREWAAGTLPNNTFGDP